jgi:hypothetical protein
VKVWYHVVAALVGFAAAALIVYWVFGNASEQGARQEGSAGALGASETLCGTIAPSAANSQANRTKAADNLPVLANENGPIPAIRDDKPDQKAWFARVTAAAGFCADEIKVELSATTIEMSTTDGVSDDDASAFAAGALAEAFTAPLQRPKVTIVTTVGDDDRTVTMSRRAWNAFKIYREARNLPLTMHTLAQFRRTTSFSNNDLRVVGWR